MDAHHVHHEKQKAFSIDSYSSDRTCGPNMGLLWLAVRHPIFTHMSGPKTRVLDFSCDVYEYRAG